jgi:hypothetical protein
METVFALLARDSLADATNSIKPQALRNSRRPLDQRCASQAKKAKRQFRNLLYLGVRGTQSENRVVLSRILTRDTGLEQRYAATTRNRVRRYR